MQDPDDPRYQEDQQLLQSRGTAGGAQWSTYTSSSTTKTSQRTYTDSDGTQVTEVIMPFTPAHFWQLLVFYVSIIGVISGDCNSLATSKTYFRQIVTTSLFTKLRNKHELYATMAAAVVVVCDRKILQFLSLDKTTQQLPSLILRQ